MAAAHGGDTEALELLLEGGAQLALRDHTGRTAEDWAKEMAQTKMQKLLRRTGTRVNLQSGDDVATPAPIRPASSLGVTSL